MSAFRWHFLYFLPLPHQHRELRPGLSGTCTPEATLAPDSGEYKDVRTSWRKTGLLESGQRFDVQLFAK